MLWRIAGKMVLAVSLLAGVALAVLHWRSFRRELVVSDAQNGTYREARVARGRVMVTVATGWMEDHKPRTGWVASRGQQGFDLTDGRCLVDFGAPTASSPVKSTGSLSVIRPVILSGDVVNVSTVAPSTRALSVTTAPVIDVKGTISWPGLRAPSLSSGGTGVGGDVQASLGSDFELTIMSKPKPPPPRTQTWSGSITVSGAFKVYPYERYTLPLPLITGVVLTPVWCKIVAGAARWRRRRGRVKRGLCVVCGYDLRGSAGTCPECGTAR